MSTVGNRSALRAGAIAMALAPVLLLGATSAGWCGNNKNQSAPAPRAAAPSRPSFSAPQGNAGRGGGASPVHIPGGGNTAVHVPGGGGSARGQYGGGGAGAGGNVHLPSSMAAHARPAQPAPAQPTRVATRQPHPASTPGSRPAAPHPSETHEAGTREAGTREAGTREAGTRESGPREANAHPGQPRVDPRIGTRPASSALVRPATDLRRPDAGHPRQDARVGTPDGRAMHTAGVTGANVVHAGPREALRPDAHRDVARERQFAHDHAADFHTRRVADFDRREMGRWRGGLWRNEWHDGRRGWWFDVGGVDYPYAEPIFPFPEDVAELVVYDTPVIDGPDLTLVELGPEVPVEPGLAAPDAPPADIPPLPATPVGWYRCDQPGGYYPGLDTCGTYWALVQNAPMPGE